ncbi:MAG TPA: DUF3365 domain-containing protein [Nitrospirota bacterium]
MTPKPEKHLRLTLLYALPFFLIITALFIILLIWEEHHIAAEQSQDLRETANALVRQVIVTRRWNAKHGGVYVPVTDTTQPNPYLVDPGRDIVSRSGVRYTKMNPAYMTREISELARSSQGYLFRLTSAKPMNPVNKPDPWETIALRDFEQGARERGTIETGSEGRFYRYMAPLITEAACLACHARQGYRLNDIRGGISVSIPMKTSDILFSRRVRSVRIRAAALWLTMTIFLFLVFYILSRKVSREIAEDLELNRLKTTLELAGAAAHDIRQPLTVIVTYAGIIKKIAGTNDLLVGQANTIIAQCRRIDETIARMQNITNYSTKPYLGNREIVDLGTAPDANEDGKAKR